jgi:hypothetical protein
MKQGDAVVCKGFTGKEWTGIVTSVGHHGDGDERSGIHAKAEGIEIPKYSTQDRIVSVNGKAYSYKRPTKAERLAEMFGADSND